MAPSPKDRPELPSEYLRAVQTDADGSPAQKRVGLATALEVSGHLVSAEVQGADDGGLARARLGGHRAVRLELFFFGRRGAAVEEEEFCPEQADAIGSAGLHRSHVFGPFDVGRENDGVPVERHRRLFTQQGEFFLEERSALLELTILEERLIGRVEREHASVAIQQRVFTVLNGVEQGAESDHRRDAHLPGHDGGVAGLAAGLGGKAQHMLPIQQCGHAGGEIVGHQNAGLGELLEVVPLARAREVVQHPTGHVAQIRGPLAEVGVIHRSQNRDVLFKHVVEGGLGTTEFGADLPKDLVEQGGVFQHQQVRLKESGLGGSHRCGNLISHLLEVMPGAQNGPIEAFDFAVDRLGRDLLTRDLTSGLPHPQDAGMRHAIRNRNSAVGARSRMGWLLGHGSEAIGRRVGA